MKSENNPVYILSSARIPFMKSQTRYAHLTRQDLMVAALNGLVQKANLSGQLLGDVALGAILNSSSDWNLARECVLATTLDPKTPGYNVQRACGTGLENAWQIGLKITSGAMDVGIAGGVDSNSDLPIEVSGRYQRFLLDLNAAKTLSQRLKIFSRFRFGLFKPKIPTINEPRTGLSMGQHCELMVKQWQIAREEQDKLAYLSHMNGAKAYEEGFYEDLVIPFQGVKQDGIIRKDTTLEKLAQLKPSFDRQGTLTAGNSSPLTDGAACVLLGSPKAAERLGLTPLAKLIDAQVAGVDFVHGAGLLMAPTLAIPRLLARNQLTLADFDYYEIHEAFAAQVLCSLKALESDKYCKEVLGLSGALGRIDRSKMNVVGSSIAMGHPFAATGARIIGTLAKLLASGNKRGLISICTAGGMGVAAIMESV